MPGVLGSVPMPSPVWARSPRHAEALPIAVLIWAAHPRWPRPREAQAQTSGRASTRSPSAIVAGVARLPVGVVSVLVGATWGLAAIFWIVIRRWERTEVTEARRRELDD